MLSNREFHELVDKYLRNELDSDSYQQLHEIIQNNRELRLEFEEKKRLITAYQKHNDQKKIRQILNEVHKEINIPLLRSEINLPNTKSKRSLANSLKIVLAAASIAIVSTVSILYFSGLLQFSNQPDPYSELKKDIDKISKNQKSIWTAVNSNQKIHIQYTGTCFGITNNGYLVTNYHLVKNSDSVIITNKIDSTISAVAHVVYKDKKHDLALLQANPDNLPYLKNMPLILNPAEANLGEYVYTLGYSKNDIVFGEGSVSSLTGYLEDSSSYQVSIPANPGNSGGPLIDSKGNLIGIISGKEAEKANVTFAIRSIFLKAMIDSVSTNSEVLKPELAKNNGLKWLARTEQVKKLQPIIYKLEVYSKN